MTYHVRLTQFEGPLDLLLHLIRRDKINIYDIPISHITNEYLAYIEIMKELRLEVAGEFFVMAATLIRIKAQMLLPRRLEEEEEEDPRDELVRNLLEYRKFKEAAGMLAVYERDRRRVFTRPTLQGLEAPGPAPVMEVSVFDLMDAFRKVMAELKRQVSYRIEREPVTVEEKIEIVRSALATGSEVLFTELFAGATSRFEIIVTFLAILELSRLGELSARQVSRGSDIWLYRAQTPVPRGAGAPTHDIIEQS